MKLLDLLLESRIDFLKEKYIPLLKKLFPGKNPEITFEFIKDKIDPTPNKIYLQWFLNEILKLDKTIAFRTFREDWAKWNVYLSIYDKVKPRLEQSMRDINKLSLEQLKDIALQYKGKEEEILTKNDYLDKKYKIVDNDIFEVYMFKTETEKDFKMYQLVSTNTEWCTRPDYDTFQQYIQLSPLFVFIYKENRNIKYQFHLESMQFMDKFDKPIDEDKINSGIYSEFILTLGNETLFGMLLNLIKNYIPFDNEVNGFKYYLSVEGIILYSSHSNTFALFKEISFITELDVRISEYQTEISDALLIQRGSKSIFDNYAIFLDKDLSVAYGPFEHYYGIKNNKIYFKHYANGSSYAYDYKNNQLYNADDNKLSKLDNERDSEIIFELNHEGITLKGYK